MVCHRWTLVLILICIPLLVTVISAFRVRLPGTSPDARSVSKKNKCENCDVNEPNLDQDVNSYKASIATHSNDDTKIKTDDDLKSKKKYLNNKVSASEPLLYKIDEQNRDKNLKNKKSVFSFNFGEEDSEEFDSEDGNKIKENKFKSKAADESFGNKYQKEKTDDNDDDNDEKIDDDESEVVTEDEDVDDYNDDDDDDDDDDDEEEDEDNYAKMIKLIKERTSEAVKGISSEDKGHEVKNLKFSLHTSTEKSEKGRSKESLDKKESKKSIKAADTGSKGQIFTIKKEELPKEKSQKTNYEKQQTPIKASSEKVLIEKTKPIKEIVKDSFQDKAKIVKNIGDEHHTEKLKSVKVDEEKKIISDKVKLVQKESDKLPQEKSKQAKAGTEKLNHDSIEKVKDKKQTVILKEKKAEPKEKHVSITKSTEEKSKVLEISLKDTHDNVKIILKNKREDKSEPVKKIDKKESEIQHMTEALKRKNLLQSEFEDIYSFLPTFAPNFSRVHNPECRRHGQILLRQLRGTKLWALNMLDATAKIPTGLLQGNGIQLGNFDQCLGTRARVQLESGSVVKVQGKYCLAMLDLKANHPQLEIPVYLAQSKNLFKSRLDDPGHFVPRFSTLNWGVCVPSPCDPEDVEVMIRDALKHYQKKVGVTVRVKVNEYDCHVANGVDWWEEWLEIPTIATLSFYLIVVLLVLIATIQDYIARQTPESSEEEEDTADGSPKGDDEAKGKDSQGGFLHAFSLYNTISKLIAPPSVNEIPCIHGLRGVATVALVIAHKFLPVAVTPYTNRLKLSEVGVIQIVSSPLLSWCRTGWMFTDCFLLLSGALTSYRTSKDDSVVAKVMSKYLRYGCVLLAIRLTPALLAVVLFYAYVWDNIGVGPMWGLLVTRNAEICQESWWWNILYVQNYIGFDNMCAPQTHQLALDLQLTVLGGIVIWAIQSEVPMSWVIMPVLHLLSAYSRYTTYRDHRLTAVAYHGVSVSQLYRTGTLSYTSTYHRCSPYLIGLSLGLMLRKPSRIGKFLLTLGWLVWATLTGLVLWAGADAGSLQYRYDATFAAQYATLAPFAVALAFAWIIYTVHNGHFGLLSSFLSSWPLLFISRISYALYLIQFVVFLTNSAIVKTSKEFSLITLFDFHEISTILSTSIILTLLFVIPIQSLPRISFTSKQVTDDKDNNESSTNETEDKETVTKPEVNSTIREEPPTKTRSFMAHREVLEEIPEVDVEYEVQREPNEGLEEIIEEEDEELEEEMMEHIEDEELEVIEEEQGGEDFWTERDENLPSYTRPNQELEEWEWTNENDESGAQKYRYSR